MYGGKVNAAISHRIVQIKHTENTEFCDICVLDLCYICAKPSVLHLCETCHPD